MWAMSPYAVDNPPDILDAFDQIYLTISLKPGQVFSDQLGMELGAWLEGVVWPFQIATGKPVILALEVPSGTDLQTQADLYQHAIIEAIQREWITGVVTRGYYPAAALQDEIRIRTRQAGRGSPVSLV